MDRVSVSGGPTNCIIIYSFPTVFCFTLGEISFFQYGYLGWDNNALLCRFRGTLLSDSFSWFFFVFLVVCKHKRMCIQGFSEILTHYFREIISVCALFLSMMVAVFGFQLFSVFLKIRNMWGLFFEFDGIAVNDMIWMCRL